MTRHPMFPAVAALWFGALFGLGSLAIRSGLIEGLVLKTGIDTIFPAAAPPLGVTARILMALALAVVGGMFGAGIARKLAEPNIKDHQRKRGAAGTPKSEPSRGRDAHPDAPARRPVSVNDEFGHDEIGHDAISSHFSQPAEPSAPVNLNRRGALVFDAGDAEFQVMDDAPLPCGGQPQIFELDALDELDSPTTAAAPFSPAVSGTFPSLAEEEDAPLDLKPFSPLDAVQPTSAELAAPPAPAMQKFDPTAPLAAATTFAPPEAMTSSETPLPVSQPAPVAAAPRQEFSPAAQPQAEVPQAETAASVFTMPQAAAIDFAQATSPVVGTATLFTDLSADVASDAAPQEAPATAPSEELDALDLVGLTERFAQSLKQRRAKAVATPLAQVEMAEADAAPLTLPAFSAVAQASEQDSESPVNPVVVLAESLPPLVLPSALRPINLDQLDDDDSVDHSNLLPLRRIAMPVQVADPEPVVIEPTPTPVEAPSVADMTLAESDEDTEDDSEGAYSSLLDLNRDPAPRQQFVRIEEPVAQSDAVEPVVIFPGQAAPEGLRQFDAPGAAQFGQPITPQAAVPNHDPEETERALRAALASLQRMSGAA